MKVLLVYDTVSSMKVIKVADVPGCQVMTEEACRCQSLSRTSEKESVKDFDCPVVELLDDGLEAAQ